MHIITDIIEQGHVSTCPKTHVSTCPKTENRCSLVAVVIKIEQH